MRSFDQLSSSSPVLALSPQAPPQSAFKMNRKRPTFTSPFSNNASTSPIQSANSAWSTVTPPTPAPPSAGRKRSRDDAADNLGEAEYFPVQPLATPRPENEEEWEWEYGEGMTLIKPNRGGYIIDAGSQTGTWAEEKAEEDAKAAAIPTLEERPLLRSAKSQRLDLTATPAIAEEVRLSNGALVAPPSPTGTTVPAGPTVDDFTRHLGIGWSSISADEHIQAAARGWTKFIENHFPVTDPKIRLQSRGLASYLVEANEGYFLFGEDLKQGRLVNTSLEKTFENLRAPVPVFDGDGVMEAGETPKVDNSINGLANGKFVGEIVMNETHGSVVYGHQEQAQNLEVEMDMS